MDALWKFASGKLDAKLAADAKQPGISADEAQLEYDTHLSSLNELVETMKALPVENYDSPLAARIQCVQMLDAPDHEEQVLPQWLTSPLRRELQDGKAAGGATQFAQLTLRSPARSHRPSAVRRGATVAALLT